MTGPAPAWVSAYATGTWRQVACPECLTDAMVEADAYELSETGVRWVALWRHCPRCVATGHRTDLDG